MVSRRSGGMGLWAIVAIGVGGMVGGGIFAVLGLAVQLARGGTPVAFLFAGAVALLTSYSYARLSVRYPSQGGTVEFLNQGFGVGVLTGSLNVLLWISYMVMLALYAFAFGSYGASLFPDGHHELAKHVLITLAVAVLTVLNALGSRAVGEAEEWIVGFKVAILLLFVGVGLWGGDYGRALPSEWATWPQLIAGGMVIFLAYEGFELIANAAGDVDRPERTLPRAYAIAVISVIVLYVLVSLVTVVNLSVPAVVSAKDYALAEAARPFLGSFGFTMIAVAAMLSTGSAINATLYGAARVSYVIAKDGELPRELERNVWKRPLEGLILTAVVAVLLANLFDLSSISMMGSAGFLIIFAAVNGAALRLREQVGARAWVPALGLAACTAALATLVWQRLGSDPAEILVLVAMIVLAVAVEGVYRGITGRRLRPAFKRR